MSAAKDNGKAYTPRIERLIQPEGNSDSRIISQFGDVYMIEINTIFVKEIGMETPQIFDPRTVINSTATVCSDLKTYAQK